MSNNTKKDILRKWAKETRKTLDLKRVSAQIENQIRDLERYKNASTVMSYLAKDIEISLSSLFQDKTKSWFLPVLQSEQIIAAPYILSKTQLKKHKFGILEPQIESKDCFDQIKKKVNLDVIFVPGLCFDKHGNRIGFGSGFYDEFLKLNKNSFKIGCCPKECLVDSFPIDEWDVKVDLVITD